MARMQSEDFIGTCQWCFGEYKVNNRRRVVLHGYQRPGYGYTVGNCRGYDHAPFEDAHDLTEERIAELKDDIARCNRQIKMIDDGKITKLLNPDYVPENSPKWEARSGWYLTAKNKIEFLTPEHPRFARLLEAMKHNLETEIKFNQSIADFLQNAVNNWTKGSIVGLDSPATGRERYIRGAYDPEQVKKEEELAAARAERAARPGKIAVHVYAPLPFPDRNANIPHEQWADMIRKTYDNEAAFKKAIKEWAKATFPGKLWVGDGDTYEVKRAGGPDEYTPGTKMECIVFRPDWSHVEDVMKMFPNAHRCDNDGNRDRVTMQCIGKGKDIRLWVPASDLPGFTMPKFSL